MPLVHDRQLLDTLESAGGSSMELSLWRVSWATRPVLQGGWAAGRWNSASTFEALYTSLELDGAVAEIYFHLSQHPVTSSADKLLHRLSLRTSNTLDLTDARRLEALGLGARPFALTNVARSQEIGAAAHLLEFDSILVPSARWHCHNLVLITEHFDLDAIRLDEPTPINFPAWREQRASEYEEFQEMLRKARGRP